MRYVVDTHALAWFFANDRRLGEAAAAILDDRSSLLVIPAIVLAEIKHIADRERIAVTFSAVMEALNRMLNCVIVPLDAAAINRAPAELDIHDGLIVGTALYCRAYFADEVVVLTRDARIVQYGAIPTRW